MQYEWRRWEVYKKKDSGSLPKIYKRLKAGGIATKKIILDNEILEAYKEEIKIY